MKTKVLLCGYSSGSGWRVHYCISISSAINSILIVNHRGKKYLAVPASDELVTRNGRFCNPVKIVMKVQKSLGLPIRLINSAHLTMQIKHALPTGKKQDFKPLPEVISEFAKRGRLVLDEAKSTDDEGDDPDVDAFVAFGARVKRFINTYDNLCAGN